MMVISSAILQFSTGISNALTEGTFIKVSLGNYKGADQELKNIYIRQIKIKREAMLSFTFRYKTRDVVKNYDYREGISLIVEKFMDGFGMATLFSTTMDLALERKGTTDYVLKKKLPTLHLQASTSHNKEKKRLVEAKQGKTYLYDLNITDAYGEVFKNAQNKYKQINQYIELLSPMLKDLDQSQQLQVVDMGSGKGYLTFALYDYLHEVLNLHATVTGVEYREDLVTLCNGIAANMSFNNLHFVQGTIQSFEPTSIDLLIALHACDTATDDAIFKGIRGSAKLIVVAPCCHKQIRKEMAQQKTKNELDFLVKYGVFMERQAEMVTDGLRALILAYFGYKTKVMEFISDVHTPKNVMLVGVKAQISESQQQEVLHKIKETKAYFGIRYHHLERLLGLEA